MSDEFKMTTGQAHELAMAFGRNGWTNADVKRLSEGDLLARLLPLVKGQAEIAMVKAALPSDATFKVEVDYGQSLEAMIASGRYDFVNDDITPGFFPISGEGKVLRELVLVHMNKMASTDEILAELARRGLRPAKIEELLALGAARPELQKEFGIVALGSHFMDRHGGRFFACLDWRLNERHLFVLWVGIEWSDHYRFLAVHK